MFIHTKSKDWKEWQTGGGHLLKIPYYKICILCCLPVIGGKYVINSLKHSGYYVYHR